MPITINIKQIIFLLYIIILVNVQFSYAQLNANFSANITSGCAPLTVTFTDNSTGNPTSWKWFFGNGTTSTNQNPSIIYYNPGSYAVKLIITNASGADSIIKTDYIVVSAFPEPQIAASTITGCYPLPVQFNDISNANGVPITNWQWDFGDGNTSTLQNPLHTYTAAGSFSVTLKVTNSNGCFKIISKPNYIKVDEGITTNFLLSNTNNYCAAPTNIEFINTSTGGGTLNYFWNFGDGATSTLLNPTHNYNSNGSYTVSLIVTNNIGCTDTLVQPSFVNIGNQTANFSVNNICIGTTTSFTNTSSVGITGALWNFGDGTTSSAINPTHTYSSTGNYTVQLISFFGNCSDTVTNNITIQSKPTASFSANNTKACTVPFNVTFNNTSIGGNNYIWNFGDTLSSINTSTLTNPSHIYDSLGNYSVTLIVTNNFGCADTIKKIDYIKISPTSITSITGGIPYQGCAPFSSTFGATIQSLFPVTQYQWDFGDGTPIVNTANPFHAYTALGTYAIQLIITTTGGCTDTLLMPNAVVLSTKPTASFVAAPTTACAQTTINFTDLTSGTFTNWLWLFGDGATASTQNATHNYSDTGKFTVTLIVSNNNCKDTVKIDNYITILPPIAKYIYSINCDSPYQRVFSNTSIEAKTSFWDFGDGTTDTATNPIHNFPINGSYVVTLTVTNGSCSHTSTQTIIAGTPHANFSVNATEFCKQSNVIFSFVNTDTTLIDTTSWNFGDRDTLITNASISSVQHAYLISGNYFPTVIVKDIFGCYDTIVQTIPIQTFGPTAGFTKNLGTCLQSNMQFIDTTTTDGIHAINQWIWNYGDGVSDTLSAPPFSHSYNTTGTFSVQLIVKDSYGCIDSITNTTPVLIVQPIANFSVVDTLSCNNIFIQFTNTSQTIQPRYSWSFGDNSPLDTATNPVHSFSNDGNYTIKLIVTDTFGCLDSITKVNYIHIINPQPNFSFLVGDTVATCYPFFITVNNQSNYTTSILWSFGDNSNAVSDTSSHFYNYVGTYNLTLYAYGYGGCVDSVTKKITITGPTGSLIFNPMHLCINDTVSFKVTSQNALSYVWDFNDGNILPSVDTAIQYAYHTSGNFSPTIILSDSNGCQIPLHSIDTIKVAEVITKIKSIATQYCDSALLHLYDSSIVINDVKQSFYWNFGDNTNSILQNPQHNYTTIGNYTLSLKVTSALGCSDTDTSNIPIQISLSPIIKILGDTIVCENTKLYYQAEIVRTDTLPLQWNWNFANGSTSTFQNPPPQYFANSGNYNIYVTAFNTNGCKDSVAQTIHVNPLPNTDAGVDTFVCNNNTIQLQATGALNYVWNNNASLSCIACSNPTASPNSLTLYTVTGTNVFGCSTSDSLYVNVYKKQKLKIPFSDTLCLGKSSQLIASGTDKYLWTPAASLNNAFISNPIATPTTTTTYTVYGSDEKFCFTDTGFITVYVYPYPTINIIDSFIYASVGSIIPLNNTPSSDIIQFKWLPNKWLSCYNCATPLATINNNIKYVLEVSNIAGCKMYDEVSIIALCDNKNIFIPNTFSPNGDGTNDYFYPRGKGLTTIKSMRIFNRWGQEVFNKQNFYPNTQTDGWDGTFKGEKLTSDVYVYVIEALCNNNQITTIKGDITLLR